VNRRESLVGLSAIAAHVMFPQVLERFAVVSQTLAAAADRWEPELLTSAQAAKLAEIVETIVPETDTPGAKAARVHVFVDLALARCVLPAQQQQVLAAIDGLPGDFASLGVTERQKAVEQLPAEALTLLRDFTVLGYCTSEPGATRGMAYEPVPGGYRGCIDLKPGQKAWATR